ncbi:FHA domain-containing protein [Corallococcus sp. H22C18031201]|uniref:FHA domain-containing protein n=1 Tax=Citreicoccus inhibens TaxID=2849499 RepID=UPI000E7313DA|nr:FHA domain-containing protein [Citreicoccus inhibens]MBU8896571.1 FHA domain-containing protein [Citreicoccus inhibens]RJS18721.1 FHA domain-containing protein [Corallococcus sp. H22C18031201]
MPIRLTITQGLQQGRELVFESAEVKIGRTSENDLVLHDHGVSRRHANLVERGGQYFASDMGSSNGTLVNGQKLTAEQQLRDGDLITVGPVSFTFVWVPPEGDEDATRPIRRELLRAQVSPAGKGTAELAALEVAPTGFRPALVIPEPAAASGGASAGPSALDKVAPGPAPVRAAGAKEPLSAAERARHRRELKGSARGQVRLWWEGMPRVARWGAVSVAGLGLLSLVAVVLWAAVFRSEGGLGRGAEPSLVGAEALADSFGLGKDVTWERVDQKAFDFTFVSPTRALAVLHYQARDISKEEVNLVLNGVEVGWVPADTNATAEREIEQLLPVNVLRRGQHNQILFDNVRNPPGHETWRVWNLRLEVIPVPELPPDQLLASARQYASAGKQFYELRDVGAENLFKAWQQYRFAWVTLEALETKPDLYEDVRDQLGIIVSELDQKCAQLMLEFQRHVQYRNRKKAKAALEDVRRRFPTTDHRCHNLALEKAYEHEL